MFTRILSFILCFIPAVIHSQYWQQITDFPSTERDDGVVFVIGDRAYCGTGHTPWFTSLEDFHVLNMTSGTWSSGPSLPASAARQYACAFSYNGSGYVFGGVNTQYLNDLWKLDTSTSSWSQKTAMPDSGRNGSAVFVIDSAAYIIGGKTAQYASLSDVWAYDIVNDSWEQKSPLPGDGIWHGNATAFNGKGYAIFGRDSNANYSTVLYEYDPSMDSWTTISTFPNNGRVFASMNTFNNQLIVMAGEDSLGLFLNDLWRYNLTSNTWSELIPLPDKGRRGGVMFTNGSNLYYSTGLDSLGNRLRETWVNTNPLRIENQKSVSINCYPIPVHDRLFVEIRHKCQYMMLSSNGQHVQTGELDSNNNSINVGTLSSGIYFLNITMGSESYWEKIIVQ